MEEKNDLGIKHLAHKHLLILNESYIAKEGDICQGCREPMDSCKSFVYSCSSNITSTTSTSSTGGVVNLCVKFLLHKTCAELPPTIVHPTHPKVSLFFDSIPQLSRYISYSDSLTLRCNVCGSPWRWFSYCSSNSWDYVCFKCALFQVHQSKEDPTLVHPGHSYHPLALIQHPSSFKCYACRVDDNIRDMSYRCTKCQFWIHKCCGDAPASFRFQFHHKHPLTLSFSLPQAYRTFSQHCRLCNKTLNCLEWLYCCNSCRFFTHFRCARSRSSPLLSSGENETCPNNLVHLPAADELSVNLLLEQLIKDKITLSNYSYNSSSISGETNYIKHWAHKEHDLKLITINELYDGENDDDEISLVCECCVKPIQTCDTLFYGCVPCKYLMHKVCAEFPREVEHHLWPGKTLCANKYSQPFKVFWCGGCGVAGNGIFFWVRLNDYDDNNYICLDIGCVSLPKAIKHEAHHHQLDQVFCKNKCNACGYRYQKLIMYRCEKCKFYLCGRCIMKERTYKHRWDPHPLELRYDACMVEEHEHEFDCEYCSGEIDTNKWFYHCTSTCDLSFHPHCIEISSWFGEYKYVKFGAADIIIDKLHPHRLTFVLNKKVRSCKKCDFPCLGERVLQCATCNVIFCWWHD